MRSKNSKFILDTSAIIAVLKKEKGYKVIEEIIGSSCISSVNLSELVSVLVRLKVSEVDELITDLVPDVIDFDEKIAIEAGKLSKITKDYGLSLGDRACISTGIYYGMKIYTTDKVWASINEIKSNIVLIR